jgi:flagellar protein FlgJ
VATATTTEVIDGVARKVQARFRAYASAAESFADYARLISSSPRYAGVMNAVGSAGEGHAPDARSFAQGLQKAGYATDPAYADKLGRVINTTLRLQRLGS